MSDEIIKAIKDSRKHEPSTRYHYLKASVAAAIHIHSDLKPFSYENSDHGRAMNLGSEVVGAYAIGRKILVHNVLDQQRRFWMPLEYSRRQPALSSLHPHVAQIYWPHLKVVLTDPAFSYFFLFHGRQVSPIALGYLVITPRVRHGDSIPFTVSDKIGYRRNEASDCEFMTNIEMIGAL